MNKIDTLNYSDATDSSPLPWTEIVTSDPSLNDNPEFHTDEFQALIELTEQINAGEVLATDALKEELGDRAIALAQDESIYALQTENVIAHVLAVDPSFKDDAHHIVEKLYADSSTAIQNIAHRAVDATFELSEDPSNGMLENVEYMGGDTDTVPIRLIAVTAVAQAVHIQTQSERVAKAIDEAKEYAATSKVNEVMIEERVLESSTVDLPTGELPLVQTDKVLVNA